MYRQAIKRTFANLYSVSSDTVEVTWTTGRTIVVHCAGKTFLHPILSEPDDDAPQFTCPEEDPVIVTVHMVPKGELTTLPKYDEMVTHQGKLSLDRARRS